MKELSRALISASLFYLLFVFVTGQSVKGGRNNQNSQYGQHSSQMSSRFQSSYNDGYSQSSSQQMEEPVQRQYYSRNNAIAPRACERPAAPDNGMLTCKMTNDRYTCKTVCNPGYKFPDGTDTLELECSRLTGLWAPYRNFPECVGGSYAGGYGHGSSQQSSYSSRYSQQQSGQSLYGGGYGRGSQQVSRQNLCGQPRSPKNGGHYCSMSNGEWSCQGTCNPGYEFPDGTRQATITCNDIDGQWTPTPGFEDCRLLCHPECENGGQCAVHNQCLCPASHRGNRCQYPVSLCDFNLLSPKSLYSYCTHNADYTECRISCPPGTTLRPPTSSVFRCTVDGHWNPPVLPECVRDSLCEKPPPPMNGRVQCQGNGEVMICQGICMPGYLFKDGFSELSIQCVTRTGQWTPNTGFPHCEPICNPECKNGAKCIGHNSCLCPTGFRGGRCEYPTSNCDAHDRFASVAWQCINNPTETICNVSCGQTGNKLQPLQPTVYTCSLDGTWHPDQKPICVTDYSMIDRRTSDRRQGRHQRRSPSWQRNSFQQNTQDLRHGQFTGQQPVDYDFGGQQQVDYEFEGQQPVDYDFDGQQPVDYDFGGQQPMQDNDFPVLTNHGFQEIHRPGEDEYHKKPPNGLDMDVAAARYRQDQNQLTREEQGLEAFDVNDLPARGGIEQEVIDDQYRMKDEDAQEVLRQKELEGNGKSDLDIFANIEKVSQYKGICSTWGFHHFRSFDGGVFTFPSSCRYTLASNCDHEDLTISLSSDCNGHSPCTRTIGIQLNENRYLLSYDRGLTLQDGVDLPIPTHFGDLTVERITRYLVARLTTGFTIWLNEENSVLIVANQFMKNHTCGLCGNYDGYLDSKFLRKDGTKTDDIFSFANSWKIKDFDGDCVDDVQLRLPCSADNKEKRMASDKANLACAAIYDAKFKECSEVVDPDIYYGKCQMDCCSTMAAENCECASVGEFVLECSRNEVDMKGGWRQAGFCPMVCENGTLYNECGPPCPPTCDDQEPTCQQERCVDGCHCPEGKVLENGQCISVDQCPCHYVNKVYVPGQTMQQDCNTCICQGGKWQCTDSICPATCSAFGVHFTTFDGLVYDLVGRCSYYLVEADNFNVQVEYSDNCKEAAGVCVRSITIHTEEGAVVRMKPTMEVSINGREMLSLPVLAPGAYIGQATSSNMRAQLSNGLEILWDLNSIIQIYAPTDMHNKLRGLCGTFSRNQQDEFLTPEGDIEKAADVFVRKWLVEEACEEEEEEDKPCDRFPEKGEYAARVCNIIKSDLFKDCQTAIDVERYYTDCMEDVCSCGKTEKSCICLSLSNYASACSRKGIQLPWRQEVSECGIVCPLGQVYLTCADPCSYTCSEIAQSHSSCRESCVEGCACPPGQTLNHHGECVPVSSCSCLHSGHVYPPEFLQRRGKEMCECSQGQWDCHEASPADILLTPPPHVAQECDASANQEPTDCISECPLTCSNYHHHQPCTVSVCVPGCRCQKGFILDLTRGVCVLPEDCPCHHSGRSYEEGEQVTMDCNTCTCEGGTWNCDSKPCPGICSAWGDSHFETFDGRLFDFEGVCDYVLVKARLSNAGFFSVVIRNVPCGLGGGATCGKALSITLGDSSLMLTRDHPLPSVSEGSRLSVSAAGMYSLVSTDIGISVQWDRGSKVYVIAQPIWKNELKGLCGDFNSDASDDFRSPSGGVPLILAKDFADSWRVHKFCKPATQVLDSCEKFPERRSWSRHKCEVLKSQLFEPCHHHVEVEDYYKRCVLDTCACNSGGDCECLCAVVSAYAQKCAHRGVVITWRSQELCPIQCEACDRYSPCISLCSPPTCDTYLDSVESQSCAREPCVDGCEPKPCKPGEVHKSATNLTCVPEEYCDEKPCMVIDGISYREGERINSDSVGDACQSCYCRRGQVDCVGVPCASTSAKPTVGVTVEECEFTGWTEWINSEDPEDNHGDDLEDLEQLVTSGRIPCPLDHVRSIQCRSADSQVPAEVTGQDVVCDLERGMMCKSDTLSEMCQDYEIRLYCQCHEEVTCPPGQEWKDCAFNCENSCQSLLADLRQKGACSNGQSCVPGCVKESCRFPELARDADTCVQPDMCTCKLSTGFVLAPGQVVTNGCEKCQCLNNSVICSTTLECKIEETGREELIPEIFNISTCRQGWSSWLNTHTPNELGERELLQDHLDIIGCSLTNVTDIECREVLSPGTEKHFRERELICDVASGGLICEPEDMSEGRLCPDFEIRVYCQCAPEFLREKPSTEPVRPYEVTVTVTLPPYTSAVAEKTAKPLSIVTMPSSCSFWSRWINKGRPKRGKKHGDREDTRPYILRQAEGFCKEGTISAIECRDAKTNKDYSETKEEKLVCDLKRGFLCLNRNQPDGKCQDYKIRYFCSCGEETTPVPLFIKTTTVAYIYPCSQFVVLIDGEPPLPDYNIKASSSASSSSGPDAIRIHTGGLGKAWTAGEGNQKQFIEIDLGDVRAIYGIITQGKQNSKEWVTSYQLLYSLDGVSYSYYQDENDNNKIFSANFDDSNEIRHFFKRPFEARFVRLEPLTWEGKISLRMDLLGCSEAILSTLEPYGPSEEPTEAPKRCSEKLGLSDGSILDAQLSASSTLKDWLSAKNGRLNSSYAWAAKEANSEQYIQVDFLKEVDVTGVITQGRNDADEWVTSFSVAYSDDGIDWNNVLDDEGEPKVFDANIDQQSLAWTMFPDPISLRYIRIIPVTWKHWISMRLETLGCPRLEEPESKPRGLVIKPTPPTIVCSDPMGLENGLLLDSQISASTIYSSQFSPDFARLGSDSVWAALVSDDKQYFQVDFIDSQNISGIISKGREDVPQWVTAYTVAYSNNGLSWNKIKDENRNVKEFPANYDQYSTVTNLFPSTVRARFLRIQPTKWKNWISMQIEILGCYHPVACRDRMGVDTDVISNYQLSASSEKSDSLSASDGRLSSASAWSPAETRNAFLQIDLLEPTKVHGVITKGNPGVQQWVQSFFVTYSNDSVNWKKVETLKGRGKKFKGNRDQNSAVINLFPLPVISRYIRVVPTDWHRWISLRIELLGCYHEQVCREPMGLENGVLSDGQISASSSSHFINTPSHARINDKTGWQPERFDKHPYLQVDFIEPRNVSAVVTKGTGDADRWVTEYKVVFSEDGSKWQPVVDDYGSEMKFPGNADRNTPVVNTFPDVVEARYFRIIPLTYEGAIGLRLELLGCYHPYECREPMGLESGTVYDFQIFASSNLSPEHDPVQGRLDSDTAWVAEENDKNPFIQIDFMEPTTLTGVMTRGRNDANEWVKLYRIEHSFDGQIWNAETLEHSGTLKVYRANSDNESPVTNLFSAPILTRYLRIVPVDFEKRISMRFEIIGCYKEKVCMEPMGVENELISDGRITASSFKSEDTKPDSVRLSSDSAWSPANTDDAQFIQVDFGDTRNISGIVTKGNAKEQEWITAYQVAYSDDESVWSTVENERGEPIEFPGNTDSDSPAITILPNTIQAQFIRIIPTDWKNWISLRVEILGCYHPYEPVTETTEVLEEVLGLTAFPTEPIMVGCPDPMESESSLLKGATITTSSLASNSRTSRILLNTPAENGQTGGWVPKVDDLHPTVMIEFPEVRWLTSIYIQGREDEDNWLKTLRVIASVDNITWLPVFGPDGNEVIEGNEDRNTIVGHYFSQPEKSKYVKIIPETWHRWPSFRMDLRGCHLPGASTTMPEVEPVILCPELAKQPELAKNCPSSCPVGRLCDGQDCVDPVDCSCVHEGKVYKVSDKLEDSECKHCDCALGGRSICTDKVCPLCQENEIPVLRENCSCACEECNGIQILCPSSHECIPKQRWCDGIIDCPDDETNCPTTVTEMQTTEELIISTTPSPPENATCDIMGKHINTFDGQDITYDICHHVAMKEIENGTFKVTIHKECGYLGDCKHWLEFIHGTHEVKIFSDLKIELDGHSYTPAQLWVLKKKSRINFSVEKVGEQVVIKSVNDGFTLTYDVRAHLKIEVTPVLLGQISGLCGLYSGLAEDDQQKPNGKRAFTSQEFGDSWAVDTKECAPLLCPHEEMVKALEQCKKLKQEPFILCGKILPVDQFIEFCMSSMCECLLNKNNSENKCKCDSFQPFAEACEAKLGPKVVRNWRLKHECHSECPPGMEWNDCGPSCQLTCDSASASSLEECSEKCVSGCFCPPGTVLNEDSCINPEQCADQICQGFGDPHFRTFDGLFFPFQAEGSFLIVGDKSNDLTVKGISKKCGIFKPITCLVGLDISYKGHKVSIRKKKELKTDTKKIPMEKLPLHWEGMVILGYPGRTFVVVIPQIHLEARYYEENSGFAVKVPSKKYFNKTEGLCGNCNGKKDDELKEEPLNEFVCSWQTEGERDDCMKSLEELPELSERIPLCEKLSDPTFEACHPLVDVDVYIDACNFDATHSGDSQASFCKTAMEYGRQCCQVGIEVNDWPKELGCDIDCPEGMNFEQCHKGCPQTCVSVKNASSDSACNGLKTDGCYCPEEKVLKDGRCEDIVSCDTCDEEGHVPGDTWNDGSCKKCHCRSDLTTECILEVCPSTPVCSMEETLVKKEEEKDEESCCDTFFCVPKEKDCPIMTVPTCPKGEVAKVHTGSDHCPEFLCECDPLLCPPLIWPEDLEDGQLAVMVNDSCCPSVQVTCDLESCPDKPNCDDGLELAEVEGECCTTYKCKPPKDVCVYTHMYKVVDGFQSLVEQVDTDTSYYQLDEEWEDGLCEKCSCVQSKGQLVPLCIMEHCPTIEDMSESKDYILQENKIPGKCCPDIFRVQCKDEEGNTYEADEQWQDSNDPCITYHCEDSGLGDVRKTKNIINCTECPRTAVLFPPSKALGQCCGVCKINKCEDEDELYSIGDSWISRQDPCRKAECVSDFGKVKTIYTRDPCATVPKDCPEDKIIFDENGCCKICNLTSEVSCSTAPIPEEDTIGFFTYMDIQHGGICVNEKTVPKVLQCSGACHSRSYYSLEDGDFKDMCQCCKVNVTVNRTIELRCPDGNSIQKTFLQPETCQCSKCAPKEQNKKNQNDESQLWLLGQKPYDLSDKYTEQKTGFEQEPYRDSWQFEQNQIQQQQEDYDF